MGGTNEHVSERLTSNPSQLLDAEMSKELKNPPVVEFHIPKRVFLPRDTASEEPDNLLVRLWGFQSP